MTAAVQALDLGEWETRVRDYLAFRNRLGFSLRSSGAELVSLARHLEAIGHTGPLTTDAAIRWARLPINAKPQYWAWRLHAVRMFAKHLAATDARHDVPPAGALGHAYTRGHPHIYAPEEIQALLEEARSLSPVRGLPPHTYRAFFGLLASTGLRCGEALALRREHVDLREGRLLVLKAKLGKTRALPLHPTTVAALDSYAHHRDATFTWRKSDAFFLSRRATALTYERITVTFRELRRRLGWDRLDPMPRVHDLRHTFAVRNLLRWCQAGEDVDGKIISLTAYLGHVKPTSTYWYFSAIPELMAIAGKRFEAYARMGADPMTATSVRPGFAALLHDFFLRHLMVEKGASSRTVEAYRDAFRLLLSYAEKRLKKQPVEVELADLTPALLLGFLDSLEKERGNSVRTRNARLAALKSFMRYAAARDVMSLPNLQPSLAIPVKRCDKPLLGFLSREELQAVLGACDRDTWSGERDYVLLSVAYNTGARVSELVGLKVEDVELVRGTSVRILGKGRKLRQVPLWKDTVTLLRTWLNRIDRQAEASLFPNRWGRTMTRSAVEKRLRLLVETATATCPTLAGRRVSPHTLRHTTAMHMLQAGVDVTTLALWLGHADPATTHAYVEADLAMKEKALQKLQPPGHRQRRFRAGDRLLAFLDGLAGRANTASIMRSCQP